MMVDVVLFVLLAVIVFERESLAKEVGKFLNLVEEHRNND